MKRKAILALLLAVVLSSCVKVHFEPESAQQQTDTSNLRSKEMRGQWAERISRESAGQRLWSARTLVDSVTNQYFRYGDLVAERWRAGNKSRPQPMSDTEVRDMITKGTDTQQPMFKSYEDMFEFALEQIKLSREVDDSTMTLLSKQGDYLYSSYSAVFYPTGTVEEYEDKMYRQKQVGHDLVRAMDEAFQKYR